MSDGYGAAIPQNPGYLPDCEEEGCTQQRYTSAGRYCKEYGE